MFLSRILFFFCFFLGVKASAQGSDPVWNRDFAWGGDTADYLMDMVETKDITIVSAGHTYSSASINQTNTNNGDADFWVMEHDTAGGLLWNKVYGGDSTEIFSKLVKLSDGYLLAGSSLSGVSGNKTAGNKGGYDYWIVKTDLDGNKLWDVGFGGDKDDIVTCADVLNNGNFIIGGYSNSSASGDKTEDNLGGNDYWMLVLNPSGQLVWNKTIGGDGDDIMTSVYLENGIHLGGYSNSNVSGDKTENSYGGYDYWIVNLDQISTKIAWDVTYGSSGDEFLVDMIGNDNNSNFYLAGNSNSAAGGNKTSANYGASDYWLLQIDSLGEKNWEINIGGSGNDVLTDMITSPEGAAIIGGYSNSGISGNKGTDNNGGYDYWIAKIDTLGGLYWEKNYGGSGDDSLQTLHLSCDRGLLLGGYSESDVSGDKTYQNVGENDYWEIRLDIRTKANFLADDHCYGTVMNFRDISEIWPDEWTWDFGDPLSNANSSTDQHPQHQFSAVGTYVITLTVKEGCQRDTMVQKTLEVFENKVLGKADLGKNLELCIGEELILENKDKDLPSDVTFLWSTGETTPEIVIDSIGPYYLRITSDRCYAVDSVLIDYCPIIYAPNAFTVNNDGKNDTWGFKGIGIVDFDLAVFDRWGLQVFQSRDIDDWWDGSYNFKEVQMDVYVYKLTYRGLNSQPKEMVGTVTLIR